MNIAARLERVPGDYACRIVVGPATAAAIKDRFVVNELDWIKVKDKEDAIAVCELVVARPAADAAVLDYGDAYHAALERYRAGDFPGAVESWRQVNHPHLVGTSPPAVMADRAAALRDDPPADWDGVYVRISK